MKKTLKYTGIGLLAVLGILVVWGLIEPRLLDVEHEEAAIAGLPASWEGQRIAQISDFQIGMWLDNPDTAEDAVEAIVDEEPALVLMSGDFVYHPADDGKIKEDMRAVAQIVRPLDAAGIPTYAVLGNHDYSMPKPDSKPDEELAALVATTLEREGVDVLINEAVRLSSPGGASESDDARPLYLVGIGSHYFQNDDTEQALEDVPDDAARVVMMHNPNTFAKLPADSAPLAVAGHTHGGQARLPGLPSFSYQTFVKSGEVHVDGWAPDYGEAGNKLYVNRGIGMSLLPLRINCRPELTLFTLRPASP
ncbi:MAG: metallophosphoesterase [Persicimonas sp.]